LIFRLQNALGQMRHVSHFEPGVVQVMLCQRKRVTANARGYDLAALPIPIHVIHEGVPRPKDRRRGSNQKTPIAPPIAT
jgi:hypothetical protein